MSKRKKKGKKRQLDERERPSCVARFATYKKRWKHERPLRMKCVVIRAAGHSEPQPTNQEP